MCTGGDNKATHKPEDKDPHKLESVNITQDPLTVSGTCDQATLQCFYHLMLIDVAQMLQTWTHKPISPRRTVCDCSRVVVYSSSLLSAARPLMDPLFIVPVSPLILAHFKQHFSVLEYTPGCGTNAGLSPKSGKCTYLDAE